MKRYSSVREWCQRRKGSVEAGARRSGEGLRVLLLKHGLFTDLSQLCGGVHVGAFPCLRFLRSPSRRRCVFLQAMRFVHGF